jgi:hypothetical protein
MVSSPYNELRFFLAPLIRKDLGNVKKFAEIPEGTHYLIL